MQHWWWNQYKAREAGGTACTQQATSGANCWIEDWAHAEETQCSIQLGEGGAQKQTSRHRTGGTNSRQQSRNSTVLAEHHMLRGLEADLWRHLGLLIGLRVQPSKGLQIPQVFMLRQRAGQVHLLVIAPLGRDDHTANLLDLRVVWGAHAVQVSSHLQLRAGAV